MAKFDEAIYTKALELLQMYILERNMRITNERKIILQQIISYNNLFAAEQLVRDICEPHNISIATIYNSLAMFSDANIIRMVPSRQKQGAKYEMTIRNNNLQHYICTRCGREVAFKNRAIEHIIAESRFSNFEVDSFSLVVYGHCKTCRRKKR